MVNIKKWEEMTWQEKREERFKRWLNPPDVKFVSPEAEKVYKERVTRFIKAIKLEEPDRVPVMLPTGNYPAYWAGANFKTLMYDYKKGHQIWKKYMEAFGDMDVFNGPALVPSGKIAEAVPSKVQKLPGLGLPDDASMNQFVEGEYMMADEYDLIMMDPTDYNLRVMLPRTSPFFEPFKRLPPMRYFMGTPWVAALADPEIRKIFQTLMSLTDEQNKWMTANMEINTYIRSHGYPSLFGGGPMAGAPFDHFADALRGTRGIVMDMYRQPEKIKEAMEKLVPIIVKEAVRGANISLSPVVMMPLHKGDHSFMSGKQFEEFYWPTFKKVLLGMIEEGLVPMPFAEGNYEPRLDIIKDMPRSSVVWYFEVMDMAKAKQVLGNVACIAGNVPASLLVTSTPDVVKEACRKLIETCAPGGGYILTGGAGMSKGNPDNLHAMTAAAKEYGVYNK